MIYPKGVTSLCIFPKQDINLNTIFVYSKWYNMILAVKRTYYIDCNNNLNH